MEPLEFLKWLWPVITGGITVPIVGWFKTRFMNDVPIQAAALVVILNLALMYLLKQIFMPDVPFSGFYPLLTTAQVSGQIIHAAVKTVKKSNP